jgi:polysaccharide pyruvyl transferase WcaK-like protein
MSTPRIFAFSTGQVGNIGDICFTPALLTLLRRHCPGIPADVAGALQNDEAAFAATAAEFPEYRLLRGHQWDWDTGAPTPVVAEAFDAATCMVFGSGPFMHFGQHLPRDWGYLMQSSLNCWQSADRGLPFVIMGQSFEGFSYPSDAIMRSILPKAAAIFTRESDSLAVLRKLRMAPPLSAAIPDCAWAYRGRDVAGADRLLAEAGLGGGRFGIVGFRRNLTARELAAAAEAVDRLIISTGMPVLLAGEDHRSAPAMVERLLPALSPAARAQVRPLPRFWDAPTGASVCARASWVLSGECHLAIIAAAAGTPVVHAHCHGDNQTWTPGDPDGGAWPGEGRVRSDGRKAQVFADLGLGDWSSVLGEGADPLVAAVQAQLADPAGARSRLAAARTRVDDLHAFAMRVIATCAGARL